jgi:hypothetical protein
LAAVIHLTRRAFLGSLAGLGVACGVAALGTRTVLLPGQTVVPTVARIGVMGGVESNPESLALFRTGMRNLGWVEGQNLVLVLRNPTPPSADPEAYVAVARDLVGQGVDVIRVATTSATQAAAQVTHQVPIVFNIDDPVGSGVVTNLAHPGGNATGVRASGARGSWRNASRYCSSWFPG